MKRGVFVTGIDTGVGKTVVSAILAQALGADYWKPIQAGTEQPTDRQEIQRLTSNSVFCHPEVYRLKAPMSPHAAADLESIAIDLDRIRLPQSDRPIVVEGAGGLMVPLNRRHTMMDLIDRLKLPVVVAARHYLGSINHTLLTLRLLKQRHHELVLFYREPTTLSSQTIVRDLEPDTAEYVIPFLEPLDPTTVLQAAQSLAPRLQAWFGNGSDEPSQDLT